ncbi:MAG: aminotransferase class IV [Alphaproteobacteria bacterium]
MPGSQDYAADPRNENLLVNVNGALVPRGEARVSVFDAGFVLGDGVWEGIRLHKGKLLFLDAHLERLFWGARTIGLKGLDREQIKSALHKTVEANGMKDGAHLRLMVTRGSKKTPNQDPRGAIGPATIVITAEYKQPSPEILAKGLALASVSIRCSPREMFDMRINSHSRLALIIALNEAIAKGADEALMLDPHGFVSSCNATNFFFVKGGELRTSTGDYCFNGITRGQIIELAKQNGVPVQPGNFRLQEAQNADEAFVTGTFGGVTPVREIDGHVLPKGSLGPSGQKMRSLYEGLKDRQAQ